MAAFDPRAVIARALEPGEQLLELGAGAARGGRRDPFMIVGGAVVGAGLVTGIAWALRGYFGIGIHGVMIVAAVNLALFLLGGLFGPGQRAVVGVTDRRVIAMLAEPGRGGWHMVACPRERASLERRGGNYMLTLASDEGPRTLGLPSWAEPNRKLADALQAGSGVVR